MNRTIKQGEHITMIAFQLGFRDWETIWEAPENEDLRALRDNPNVLFPGDQLFIPDKLAKSEPSATAKVHLFETDSLDLKLKLVVRDVNGDPIPNCDVLLALDGTPKKLVTDADGRIEQDIDELTDSGEIRVRGQEYHFKVGHLDPVEEQSGVRARLANLGYYLGDGPDIDEAELTSAIEEFQVDHGLDVDGKAGPKTQKKLKAVHGC